jgi:hypothetical protein
VPFKGRFEQVPAERREIYDAEGEENGLILV